MDNPRPEKVAVVDEVRERLDGSNATILAEYRGLSVAKMAELRSAMRAAGGEFKVYKNTLVRFAARDLQLEIEDLLTGPTAIAFVTEKPDGEAGDPVDVAKVLKDFGRDNPALIVKGGMLRGKRLSPEDTRALAEVEPREVLLSRLAGGMAAPMVQFAGLLQALPRNMAYGLKALIDQGGASGAPAAEEAPAEEAPAGEAPAGEAPAEEAPADEQATEAAAPAAESTQEAAPAAETDTENDAAETPAASAETPSEETQES